MEVIKRDEVAEYVGNINGKFEIVFIKRSTGEPRIMNATTKYAKHLKGGEAAYDFKAKQLIPVWDLDAQAFRSIPLDAVLTIKRGRKVITVA
jgi:hypothetical protein